MVPGRALLLAVVLLCASVTAWAQPTGKVWRIGVLGTTTRVCPGSQPSWPARTWI
jgi:endonuclease/exonuclease/phosphatase (EEP) superfamily protein YafD